MPFTFHKLELPGLVLVEPKVFPDPRGFFAEIFKASDFKAAGMNKPFVQVNHSSSQKNVLRGLHYQLKPKAQAKLVSVVRGEIFDVAVDIRRDSPAFGRWVAQTLNATDKKMLFIPEGFAHGFCVLSDHAEIIYYCTEEYAPAMERNVIWNDPAVGIKWPVQEPLLSPKDAGGKSLKEAENNF